MIEDTNETNNTDNGSQDDVEGAGGDGASENKDTNTNDVDAKETGDKAGDETGNDTSEDKSDDTKEDDNYKDDGDEPKARKSAYDFIKDRKEAKASKKESGEDKDDDDDDDPFNENKDNKSKKFDPDLVREIVKEYIEPVANKQKEQDVEAQISMFLEERPEFKKYSEKARRWALHPNRHNIPVRSIFYEIAGDDLMKIGAEKSRAADKKAKEGSTSASTSSESKSGKLVKDMTREEMEAEILRVKMGNAGQ